MTTINIGIGSTTFTAKLVDNASSESMAGNAADDHNHD